MKHWPKVATILTKDLLSELRTRDTVASVLVFAVVVIVIFNFAFESEPGGSQLAAAGILWVSFAFVSVLSLNRAFILEKEKGTLQGLMLCPVPRQVIYFGKMLSSLLFMLVVELALLPLFTVFLDLPFLRPQLLLVVLLATVGMAAVGTLFSAIAVNTRSREVMLPILFFPVVVPVIIAALESTTSALEDNAWGPSLSWMPILLAFDAVFLVLSAWVFDFVLEE
jgi:heme exporter protein B